MSEYDFTQQVGHLMRRVYQKHTAIFQQQAQLSQLTSAQFVVLCALHDHGEMSQSELIKATVIDQATIRGLLERLKKRDLVAFQPASEDRRKVMVSLTDAGQKAYEDMVPCAQEITRLTLEGLNEAERMAIHYLLKKMAD